MTNASLRDTHIPSQLPQVPIPTLALLAIHQVAKDHRADQSSLVTVQSEEVDTRETLVRLKDAAYMGN